MREEDASSDPQHRLPPLLRLARPKQWSKNVLVVAAPGAAGVLTAGRSRAFRTAIAFVCFCLAASSTYFLNDAIDVEADRRHPTQAHAPDRRGRGHGAAPRSPAALVLAVAADRAVVRGALAARRS